MTYCMLMTVREASKRTIGMRHYRVQLIGGIIHQGRITEMRTGEGKTLATLPSYLNALEGKGVHAVTVNDHLANVMEWMGKSMSFWIKGRRYSQ